jgi:alpha-ketoglutarate-dependent taurine dioxygenase
MKISKIPGLGRFGIFIDDLDFVNLTDEEWLEIGQLHLESLVTIIRNVNLTPIEYESWMRKWGTPRNLSLYRMLKKYNVSGVHLLYGKEEVNGVPISIEDQNWVTSLLNLVAVAETKGAPETQILRVSGKKNERGEPIGMFAEGELRWHSNESGNLLFAPAVSLLGQSGVVGSATGFLTTTDWYEEQSESFRSELDEMIIVHKFTPGRINPGLRVEQDDIMYRNMCPEPIELPLVIQSPIGIKGLHYSVNTINTIKDMSDTESLAMFEQINKSLFVDKNIYDHWYQQDNDLCLFDNSITLHRRLGGIADRMCYRIQYDYGKIAKNNQPYLQEPYNLEYNAIRDDVNNILNINND